MLNEEQGTDVVAVEGYGYHPGPEDFTAQLREDTGNDRLVVLWDVGAPLFCDVEHPLPGDQRELHPPPVASHLGCWTVFAKVRCPVPAADETGREFVFADEEVLAPILSLDGLQNMGMPFGLGPHVAQMLNYSDIVHRGYAIKREKDAAHRKAYEEDWARQESVADSLGRDKHIQRGYARVREAAGLPSPPKEVERAEAVKYERRYNLKKRRQQNDLKEMGL